jgi:hypothetical protein
MSLQGNPDASNKRKEENKKASPFKVKFSASTIIACLALFAGVIIFGINKIAHAEENDAGLWIFTILLWFIGAGILISTMQSNSKAKLVGKSINVPDNGLPEGTQKDQINQAKKINFILFGSNREIRRLPTYLHRDEVVHGVISGSPYKRRGRGIIVATNERIIFIKDGWVFRDNQDFSYETISSVEIRTQIFFGTFVMYGKGDETTYNWVGRFAGAKFVNIVRQQASSQTRLRNTPVIQQYAGSAPQGLPSLPPLPASPHDLLIKQLEDIARLRDAGILTLDEFELKKQELLSRL